MRITKLRKIVSFIFTAIVFVGILLTQQACNNKPDVSENKPNVIIVLTDDQGYGDFSVHGNPILKTPVLDKLHGQSIRFTDFHSSPMCTPTRGQLMTGRDAFDNGATKVCMGRSMPREELPTMADIFKNSGYQTAHFGKWHLGDSYPYRPQDRGFEETVHHGAWGITSIADNYGNTYWNDTYFHNETPKKYEGYCTDVWFDLTLDFIQNQKSDDKPFFIYLATNCPHSPHWCDDEYSDPYLGKVPNERIAKFFGQIANIDENMGRLLKAMDENNLNENTILMYMSDNGTVLGHHVYNAGMRGNKTQPYEGGHRVPLFVRWPDGNLGEPRDIDAMTQMQDILPTLIDWCGLEKPVNADFDGITLAPVFVENTDVANDRILVVEYENPYAPLENKAVLWKKWRLVKGEELYNLETDPGQTRSIAEQNPDIVKKLQDYYREWQMKTLSDFEKERYIHVGNVNQNPMMLYSSDWEGSYADNLGNLLAGNQIGYWDIIVDQPGNYEFTLSRWHPDSDIPLTGKMEVWDGNLKGSVPIKFARLKVGEFDKTIETTAEQAVVKFALNLEQGINKIETWFLDKDKKPLCSAYYTKAELFH